MVGTLDVDGMLDGLTPAQFDEWVAYREIEPDPLNRLIHIIKFGFATLANAWGAKIEPDDLDQKQPEHQPASQHQAAAILSSKLGPPNGNRNR